MSDHVVDANKLAALPPVRSEPLLAAVELCAKELPEGWEIYMVIERGALTVYVDDDCGGRYHIDGDRDTGAAALVCDALAIAKLKAEAANSSICVKTDSKEDRP